VRGYHHLRARACVAEIGIQPGSWFARHLPATLSLGDPAGRDAAIHCVQACIPHHLLLPIGVDRIVTARDWPAIVLVHATERSSSGPEFVYDLDIRTESGQLVEQWRGLRLRPVGPTPLGDAWPEPLLGPYLERRLEELLPDSDIEVAVEALSDREARRDRAIRRIVAPAIALARRGDGRPELIDSDRHLSLAHTERLTLCAHAGRALGCDLEIVQPRAHDLWRDLLGDDGVQVAEAVMREASEPFDTAATRVWVMLEALKKAGAGRHEPLLLVAARPDEWVLFGAGRFSGATFSAAGRHAGARVVFGVTVRGADADLRVSARRGV
jgi:enediyne polyketide synthase